MGLGTKSLHKKLKVYLTQSIPIFLLGKSILPLIITVDVLNLMPILAGTRNRLFACKALGSL